MVAHSPQAERRSNSTRFLNAFNIIEDYLRSKSRKSERPTFYALLEEVSASDRAVRHFKTDLKEYADLRNAIIHERTDCRVIAEPSDAAVREIERIAALLVDPPKVIPHFQTHVSTLKSSDSVAEAVKLMLDKAYSQIPIYDERGFVALLTENTVTRWLGSSLQVDILILSETTIESVLPSTENKDNHCFISAKSSILGVLEEFRRYEDNGRRLDAILITESGRPVHSLLGIITVWDIPGIYRELRSSA